MKHLQTYKIFESNDAIRMDCQDILIDLSDDSVKFTVNFFKDYLVIDIDNNGKIIELKNYSENFERLFHYLDHLGYKLTTSSYYSRDGWDDWERCPNCNSTNHIMGKTDVANWKTDDLECTDCGHKDHYSEFQTTEHPLTKGDLMWSIKNGDKPDHIFLEFNK